MKSSPTTTIAVLCLALIAAAAINLYQFTHPKYVDVPDQEVIDRFHRLFYERHEQTWSSLSWYGIPAQQNPNDAWITQEIITEVRPDFVVETGTAEGGSALLWATVLAQVNPAGRVITIDVRDVARAARQLPLAKERVDFLIGSSTDPAVIGQVKQTVGPGTVLVILDSDHSQRHVRDELELYGPLVSPGSYMIVQDTNINGHPVRPDFGPGPMEAVAEFLAANPMFQMDKHRERLLFTMHPGGYLRRVETTGTGTGRHSAIK